MTLPLCDAYVQRWASDTAAHESALPSAVRVIEQIDATDFCAAVNRRLAAVEPAELIVLSDGFARISFDGLARCANYAQHENTVVLATSPNVEATIICVPSARLIELGGLCEQLHTFYWGDELCLRDKQSRQMEVVMAYVDSTQRTTEVGARYYEALADLGVLDSLR